MVNKRRGANQACASLLTKLMNELIKLNSSQVKLSVKQKSLYLFIVEKLEKDEPINLDEAKQLYIKNSCRNVISGKPYWYSWDYDRNCTKPVPMSESELLMNTVNYITRGIGVLVLKGVLKITPQLQFN